MGYPVGVEVANIRWGSAFTAFGRGANGRINIYPVFVGTRKITWEATGDPFIPLHETKTVMADVDSLTQLPAVDQSGWLDDSGAAFMNWSYQADLYYELENQSFNESKVFKVLRGQGVVDLDMIFSGNVGVPTSGAQAVVTSINGYIGAVELPLLDLESVMPFVDRAEGAASTSETSAAAALVSKNAAEAVPTTTDGILTGIDGNAGSAFRTQSDARRLATDANPASALRVQQDARQSAMFARSGGAKATAGIFNAVSEGLRSGRSASLSVQGDSTGNSTDEWVYLTAAGLGAQYPSCHVKYKVWSDAAQTYNPWIVVQPGASGERHALFKGAAISRTMFIPAADIPHIGGDIDIRARLTMDNWTPAATAGVVARYGAGGFRGWKLSISTTGMIDFTWTIDGTNNIQKVATTTCGFADGTEGWVRVTLDVDNLTGGNTWTAYKSTDGNTWTTVGSSASNTGGATSLFNSAQEYEIGGRGLAGEALAGKIYEVQIRDGIDGRIVNAQPIDSWIPRGISGAYEAGTFGGSPTLYVINGSMPGAALSYFTDATRYPRMVHPYQGSMIVQSCSHNDAANTGAAYLAQRDAWLAQNDARAPGSQTVVVTQNPEQAPITANAANNHARRRLLLMSWGSRNNVAVVDTYKAFQDDPRGLTALLNPDGVHPTQSTGTGASGSELWASVVLAAFTAA